MKFETYCSLLLFFFLFGRLNAEPVAICGQELIFDIDLDGTVAITPEMIGEGFDDAGVVVTLSFSKDIHDVTRTYDCNDLTPGIFVLELWVQNVLEEVAFCSATVRIVDNSAPVITCPAKTILNCRDDQNDLLLTGSATATDHCSILPVTFEDDNMLECGEGKIIRTWTATDPSGNTATCTQSISMERTFSEADISWPQPYDVGDCNYLDPKIMPEGVNHPVFQNDACVLLTTSYEDFSMACGYLERQWTVIDSCTYDSLNNSGMWFHSQFITFKDKTNPVVVKGEPVSACLEENTCDAVSVVLEIQSEDNCFNATSLNYYYALDLFDDGSSDITGYANGDSVLLPAGEHLINWQVYDHCQNITIHQQHVSVWDCQLPSVMAVSNYELPLLENGVSPLEGSDLDTGSSDNCGNIELLLQYPSLGKGQENIPSSAVVNLIFDCSHKEDIQYVDLWVVDDTGNTSYTTIAVNVVDSNNICS